jgi:hypothetical protein
MLMAPFLSMVDILGRLLLRQALLKVLHSHCTNRMLISQVMEKTPLEK